MGPVQTPTPNSFGNPLGQRPSSPPINSNVDRHMDTRETSGSAGTFTAWATTFDPKAPAQSNSLARPQEVASQTSSSQPIPRVSAGNSANTSASSVQILPRHGAMHSESSDDHATLRPSMLGRPPSQKVESLQPSQAVADTAITHNIRLEEVGFG